MGIVSSLPSIVLSPIGKSSPTPCTTTTSSVKVTTTSYATTTSSRAVTTSTTAAPALPSSFWIKSSCDNSCLGTFADDDQIYSNLYTSSNSTFDTFAIQNAVLYDTTTSTLCVASEAGGTATRVQCSNDPDYINGVAVPNVWGIAGGLVTYSGSSTFYGCGVVDLADNYEPDGLTYSTLSGGSNCQVCYFQVVYDIASCNSQAPAASISTSYLAPLPTAVTTTSAASTTSTLKTTTKCTTTSKATTTKTTSTTSKATTTTDCNKRY